MKRYQKNLNLHGVLTASAAVIATAAWAVPPPYQRILAITASQSTITIVKGWIPEATGVAWTPLTSMPSSAPSTQKTIGASVSRQVIMYRKADGITRLVDGPPPATLIFVPPNFDAAAEVPIYTDSSFANLFKLVPEEIEVEPTSNDVFALVSAPNNFGPKQIYRIKNQGGAEIATAMTYHNAIGVKTPNGDRAFVNPFQNGYKAGSIAFVPKSSGGHYLIFTHQSTYYGICHWIFSVKTGSKENELWAVTSTGTLSGVPLSKCQKSMPNSLTGFGAGTGGINTVYVGPPGGVPLTNGRFMMSRNNGLIYEVKGLLDPVPTGTNFGPWQVAPLNPSISTTASSDYALVRNQWQSSLPFP